MEIDVEEQLKYEDFEIAGDAMFQIKAMQDGVKLSGFLEEYDEDGYVSFRIDESLIGIDVQPYEKFNDMVGEYVSISAEKINVYDENIM